MLARALAVYGAVETVGTCVAARRALRARMFHGIVIDVAMPDGNGLDLIPIARRRLPATCILVLTGTTDHEVIRRVHAEGGRFLLKPADPAAIGVLAQEARSRLDAGGRRINMILARWAADYELTDKEIELLKFGADGLSRADMANKRVVQPNTVKKQIQLLLQKTGDETFEVAVRSLLREALEEPT